MINGSTRVFALVGYPVRQSLSPAMHNELFQRRGVNAVYVALEVQPAQARQVAAAIRTLGFGGVNLTVPFKEQILPDLDALSPEAEAAGAVNVVINQDGFLTGFNSDGAGYVRALVEEMNVHPRGLDVGVLGAGGTGRAVAAAVAADGARRVTLYNRTLARAEQAVDALRRCIPGVEFLARPLLPEAFNAPHQLVVNCTAPAASPLVASLPLFSLPPSAIWTDANYYLSDPPQLAACAARRLRVQRGIGMLMHQGARAFHLFTGMEVGVEAIRGVLNIGGW